MVADAVPPLVFTGIALALWAISAALWPSSRTRSRRRERSRPQAAAPSC